MTAAATIRLTVNGEARSLPGGVTLAEVVAELSTAPSGVAAAVNEAVVPRSEWVATVLADTDRVEILTAVQGG
ncbi:sulfur carrier protein ThiS [Streptacidiphilus jiangxiensis]|uniref:Sulfur carrier protein n=1 Tax=Streptacidiphilus jiangxiensis TaxID=235985 RepID=A0A1H7SQI9_STRJI|nr:sulfur carrier protein ThiS [Streptacidiphilus jiangxiensis]SEL74695.1 sulfur carrier protein [Streptacidiphilus jiangxiensis]